MICSGFMSTEKRQRDREKRETWMIVAVRNVCLAVDDGCLLSCRDAADDDPRLLETRQIASRDRHRRRRSVTRCLDSFHVSLESKRQRTASVVTVGH